MNKKPLAFSLAAALMAFLFLWQQLQATRLGYRVDKARHLLRQQESLNAYLRLELTRLNSPERLAKEAAEHLKMCAPSPENQVVLNDAQKPESPKYLSFLFGER